MGSDEKLWKRRAAEAAVGFVKGKKVVGLGSGTTMAEVVRLLAKERQEAVFIPASSMIEEAAKAAGLKLEAFGSREKFDITLDGADEVDPDFNLIKGRGGAHTREKVLAKGAERLVIVIDRSKLVRKLGERSPVPVEVLPSAVGDVEKRLSELGGRPKLRLGENQEPFVTDNGNHIIDVKFPKIQDPAKLERDINDVPGVVKNGIFVGLVDVVVVGHGKGVDVLRSKRDFSRLIKV